MNGDEPQELPARRGLTILYHGKTLLSRIDPVSHGERLGAGIPVRERTLYFCPSPLYGYGLSILLEKLDAELHTKNSAVLCVEADEKLLKISERALGKIETQGEGFCRLSLIRASRPDQVCAFMRETWGERVFRRIEPIRIGGGWQLFPKLYGDIETALRRELALEWGNAITLISLGRLYARNLIRNLALLPASEDISSLNFGNSPILVLGAGPSMDSLLDELSALSGKGGLDQKRFRIICVDTCLPALHERSVLPDLVVILESQHWNLKDFRGARGRKINAALDMSALPASARVLSGKRFFFATPWTEMKLFERLVKAGILPEIYAPLGSVGLSAVAIALKATSGPVVIGGMDFSFSIDSYHARSTPGHTDQMIRQNRLRGTINAAAAFREGTFTAASKTGEPVKCDPAMRKYRDIFAQVFGRDNRLVDTAGLGLSLGLKTVSFAEAFSILNDDRAVNAQTGSPVFPALRQIPAVFSKENIGAFIRNEIEILKQLRDMLSGDAALEPARLEELLDTADYLWAHFPECAGAGGRRPAGTDLGFLKRVRAEMEPFLKLWEISNIAIYHGS